MATSGDRTGSRTTRHWLDWHAPSLPQAASWILGRADVTGRQRRLDGLTCVVPGRRSGRLLLEELLRQCGEQQASLIPPRIITPGLLVDEAFPVDQRVASEVECRLAWIHTLRNAGAALEPLLSRMPELTDVLGWAALADRIMQVRAELAGQMRSFADVAEAAANFDLPAEEARWQVLNSLNGVYRATLRRAGLEDPDDARRDRLRREPINMRGVVLIAIAELNRLQREAIMKLTCPVDVLVHASDEESEAFDGLGCVKAAAWVDRPLAVSPDMITVADRPADQAREAIERIAIAAVDGTAVDEIALGANDDSTFDALESAAAWAGLSLHRASGRELRRSPPCRLLDAIAAWLDEPRFAHFASLLRHPDLDRWLTQTIAQRNGVDAKIARRAIVDWQGLLDRYFADHLHERLTGQWLGTGPQQASLKLVYDTVMRLLAPFGGESEKSLGDHVDAALNVLAAVYESGEETEPSDSENPSIEACLALRDGFLSFAAAHASLQFPVDAASALRLLLAGIENLTLAAPVERDQVELLGWLELHLDPAPTLVLAGVSDGIIPQSVTHDAFLPDRLRTAVGLVNNDDRYARDAYLLEAILRSRQHVHIIAGRRTAEGEPLMPSRLLMACDREALPDRVRQLGSETAIVRHSLPRGMPKPAAKSGFLIPQPPNQPVAIDSISVSAISAYLRCPYRFWLERMLKLKAVEDSATELDPLAFGTLAHGALEVFASDETICDSSDSDTIAAALCGRLLTLATALFGGDPTPAVRIQIARLEQRLIAFAQVQAKMRTEGWRIKACEYELPDTEASLLDVPGEAPIRLTGKIDRIDENERTGCIRIIDYKTGDSAKSPMETHHGTMRFREEWRDLQLPLYHYLAIRHGFGDTIELGYLLLPKHPSKVTFSAASWTNEQLAHGVNTAREVVSSIRKGIFFPPAADAGKFDPFENICQSNAFSDRGTTDEEDG